MGSLVSLGKGLVGGLAVGRCGVVGRVVAVGLGAAVFSEFDEDHAN